MFVVWLTFSWGFTYYLTNTWFFRHIYYHLQNLPVQTSEKQSYYCTRNWQCWKWPWSWIKLEPTAFRLRNTNDFMTLIYTSKGHDSECISEATFKWETATRQWHCTCSNTNSCSNWAEKTHYSIIFGKYYLENSYQAKG